MFFGNTEMRKSQSSEMLLLRCGRGGRDSSEEDTKHSVSITEEQSGRVCGKRQFFFLEVRKQTQQLSIRHNCQSQGLVVDECRDLAIAREVTDLGRVALF